MTTRPIMFSTPMVQALLAGRKTQTRRLATSPLRRVEPGDLLYVRESFALTQHGTPVFRADARDATGQRWSSITPGDPGKEVRWTPSIHMPRWASRLTLEVTRVRYDRLQAISRTDCQAEGHPQRPEASPDPEVHLDAAHDWYMDVWNNLHDKPGERWADDPMIVALTFRVHHCNVDKMEGADA